MSLLRLFLLWIPLCLLGLCGVAVPAAEPLPSAPSTANTSRDELVFPDGDHVGGRFLRREGDVIVFQTTRFGEVRVRETEAKLVLAHASRAESAPAAPGVMAPGGREPSIAQKAQPAADSEEEPQPWYYLRPSNLGRHLRAAFGQWHGKLAVSTEAVSNTSERSAITVESSLRRSWKRDDLKMNLRYDFAETDDVTSTDMLKGDATWQHSLGKRWYALYHPTLEWNRDYTTDDDEAIDYLLLQQEVGVGLTLYKGEKGKLSVGVSENLFDVWQTAPGTQHRSVGAESVFVETEWKLPWQITLSERSLTYFGTGETGWENKFRIDKKLTETLSVGVSHELRENSPDTRLADYKKLNLMIGLDF